MVRDRRHDESQRREHTGAQGNDHLGHTELRRQVVGMHGARAAEGEERRALGIAAALGDVHAHGRRHRLVDDVVHGPGGRDAITPERLGEMLVDAMRGAIGIAAHQQ